MRQQHLCGPVPFGKSGRKTASWTHRSDKLRAEEAHEEGRILLCRGSLHYSQPSLLAMGFICGPNKVQQNILCSRLQSGLLWLAMKLKNVSEGVLWKRRWEKCRLNRFVTIFSDEESKGGKRHGYGWKKCRCSGRWVVDQLLTIAITYLLWLVAKLQPHSHQQARTDLVQQGRSRTVRRLFAVKEGSRPQQWTFFWTQWSTYSVTQR